MIIYRKYCRFERGIVWERSLRNIWLVLIFVWWPQEMARYCNWLLGGGGGWGVEVQIYYYWVCFVLYPLTKTKDQTRFRRELTFGGLEFCHWRDMNHMILWIASLVGGPFTFVVFYLFGQFDRKTHSASFKLPKRQICLLVSDAIWIPICYPGWY